MTTPRLLCFATILGAALLHAAPATGDTGSHAGAPQESGQATVLPSVEAFESLIAAAVADPRSVGLSVAIARGERILLAGGYGLAEVEHGALANGETMFRIGSVTKQFTSAGILKLMERDELGLGDLLNDHLPEFPTQGHEVNLLHLLTHTSGIKSYTGLGPEWNRTVPLELSHEELMAYVKDKPFDFGPGERFLYNNSGYYLLGMILEELSGKTYAEFIRSEFAEPLGLERTQVGSNDEIIPNRAQGYRFIDGKLANDGLIGMSQPGAAGAILSTAEDLIRWQLALVGGKVVAPDSYEMMATPFELNNGSQTEYGFGLGIRRSFGRPVVQHGGGINGFNSILRYYPDSKLSVAVISNCESYDSNSLADELSRVALE